mgnify:CR=1 FL=1|jgi:hypothetical protein
MLTIRARVFSGLMDNYSRITDSPTVRGAHSILLSASRVLWIRFVSLLVGAASGNPRFSTSSFPIALPLGAGAQLHRGTVTVHRTGDRAPGQGAGGNHGGGTSLPAVLNACMVSPPVCMRPSCSGGLSSVGVRSVLGMYRSPKSTEPFHLPHQSPCYLSPLQASTRQFASL